MGNFISFPEEAPHQQVDKLVLNLVDPATDAGSIARLISGSLGTLDSEPAAHFNVDPLIDYRAQRPWLNYQNGRLAGIWREGMALSLVKDVEGSEFLRLHGTEPDFHWDALLADMIDVVERFGVRSIYSFTAIGTPTPHTRPADMIVRTSESGVDHPVLEADFWFQSSFADYLEYHASRLDISTTNVAVRVPVYLTGQHYSAGAVGALSMVGRLSGLRFPLGDLQHDVIRQNEQLAAITAENEELARILSAFERDYDEKGVTPGFVTAPEDDFSVPSVDEIGRAAEQFLAQVDMANERSHVDNQFDPQGLIRRIDEIRRSRLWRERGNGNSEFDLGDGSPANGNEPWGSTGSSPVSPAVASPDVAPTSDDDGVPAPVDQGSENEQDAAREPESSAEAQQGNEQSDNGWEPAGESAAEQSQQGQETEPVAEVTGIQPEQSSVVDHEVSSEGEEPTDSENEQAPGDADREEQDPDGPTSRKRRWGRHSWWPSLDD